ncbi:hypothetical protein ACFLSW_04700 [Candidatus Bipolaricaulota bacterium]
MLLNSEGSGENAVRSEFGFSPWTRTPQGRTSAMAADRERLGTDGIRGTHPPIRDDWGFTLFALPLP